MSDLAKRLREQIRFTNDSALIHEAADRIEEMEQQRKQDCVAFFHWFWNQPGTNAEQGYDEWKERER